MMVDQKKSSGDFEVGYLERMVDDVLGRDDTIFMTGSQIAEWFVAADAK